LESIDTICQHVLALQWTSAGSAFVAAGLWFAASWAGLRNKQFLATEIAGVDRVPRLQSKLNAFAAMAAGLAAVVQADLTKMPVWASHLISTDVGL
jgi:hypothetical protein